MKLYTEEQVKEAYNKGRTDWINEIENHDILSNLTPIKLPSDEDIYSFLRGKKMYDNDWEFINGAIWMKEQILNQNK